MKKHKVRLLVSAKVDISEARKWYRQFNKELPIRFKEEVRQILESLILRPDAHAIRYKNVRFAQLNKFPYSIHYFIDKPTLTVNIIAVYHTSINPDKWILR